MADRFRWKLRYQAMGQTSASTHRTPRRYNSYFLGMNAMRPLIAFLSSIDY